VIVVDSSIWIDFFKGRNARHVQRLRAVLGTDEIIIGDLMLCEILRHSPERISRLFQLICTHSTSNRWITRHLCVRRG
jgi:predicted nucleic acid-binding protein